MTKGIFNADVRVTPHPVRGVQGMVVSVGTDEHDGTWAAHG
jgi:hypothetical protein